MDLNRFPRRRYTQGATPLHRLKRLSQSLGGPAIYIKRDDQLGLAGGGNKTRKLEFLVADALEKGADTLGERLKHHNTISAELQGGVGWLGREVDLRVGFIAGGDHLVTLAEADPLL